MFFGVSWPIQGQNLPFDTIFYFIGPCLRGSRGLPSRCLVNLRDAFQQRAPPGASEAAFAVASFISSTRWTRTLRAMKPVIQQEISGCGIASVAALAGVSYKQAQAAANQLGIFAEDQRLWSDTKYVRTLLRHFGLRTSPAETAFGSWESLPRLALLSIKWHLERGVPFWHWVVFWRGPGGPVVLDPKKALRTNVRRDFGRIKPKWFIEIRHVGEL